MTPDHRIGPVGRDDPLSRALRRLYAAPAEEAYWRTLEASVMARVAAEREASGGWWLPLARWSRVGAAAVAAALLVAGAALWRERQVRDRSALETVLLQDNHPRAQLSAAAGASPDGDAVLRYLLSP
jgi:hypothetical protein